MASRCAATLGCLRSRAQARSLERLAQQPGLDLTVLRADYDRDTALKRRFRVNVQSTLIVLRGEREVARLVGDSSVDRLREALRAAL